MVLSGKDIFKLYDTFGFPVDLIEDILKSTDYTMDIQGYEEEMLEQKKSSKVASKFKAIISDSLNLNDIGKKITDGFVGYNQNETDSLIVGIVKDNELVTQVKEGDKVSFIFDKTPFYAEMGGQVGDTGSIVKKGSEIVVTDCKKVGNFHLHEVLITSGELCKGDVAKLMIDLNKREKIDCNHSATHLLHSALRVVLGDKVFQKGSLVNDEKLRFDYSHGVKLTKSEIEKIENIVNLEIEKATSTETKLMSYQDAIDSGALAFFGDKYGDEVRVVSLGGEFSVELCGGTHVKNTSEIEGFIISNETSVSSGVRRLEAMTGSNLIKKSKEAISTVKEITEILNVPQEDLAKKIADIVKENKKLKSAKKTEKSLAAEELKSSEFEINDHKGQMKLYQNASLEMLRRYADKALKEVEFSFSVFISKDEEKVSYIVTADKNKDLSAKSIIKEVNECLAGSGGGRDDFAQGGSQEVEDIENKFDQLVDNLKS